MSIRYEADIVRLNQESPMPSDLNDETEIVIDLTAEPRVKLPPCLDCGSTAKFYTPIGVACSYHAWEAASEQADIDEGFWIPILIDRTAL